MGQRIDADRFYYISYTLTRILERLYHTLLHSPLPDCPAMYPTGFDHDVKIPNLEEHEDSKVRNSRIIGEGADLSQLVEGDDVGAELASYYDDYSDVAMTGPIRRKAS